VGSGAQLARVLPTARPLKSADADSGADGLRFLDDLQAVAVLVAEREHRRHAGPAQHFVGACAVLEQVRAQSIDIWRA
jgi:hypothetical protein